MQSSELTFMTGILVIVVSMPILAWCCTSYTSFKTIRESEATARRLAEADLKAQSLLRQMLTEQEYRQLAEHGCLKVHSPNVADRSYWIFPDRNRPVEVYESGEYVAKLCLQPYQRLPVPDIVLMHKLMIEGNEGSYLREANVVSG
ncbi:MAG: hypothetical protein ACOX87_13040 [Chloroflexota bacterium]|jgi:hypothetical protein